MVKQGISYCLFGFPGKKLAIILFGFAFLIYMYISVFIFSLLEISFFITVWFQLQTWSELWKLDFCGQLSVLSWRSYFGAGLRKEG